MLQPVETRAPSAAELSARLAALRDEIEAHRRAAAVTLVVVTKSAPPSILPTLCELGEDDLGENRVAPAAERLAGFEQRFRWHFIGHLQGNKVRRAVPLFDVFHGVDSPGLLRRIDRVAGELGRRPEVFLQVNVSGEGSKAGLAPEALPEAVELLAGLEHVRPAGLMTMAPRVPDPEQARPVFRELARLAARCRDRLPSLTGLSMGMSEDFPVALEEGATHLRIGRRLVAPPAPQGGVD